MSDPDFFDVLIIGAGPAGLSAAKIATEAGASVAIIDDNPRAGGQIWRSSPAFPPSGPALQLLNDLDKSKTIRWLRNTRIVLPLPDKSLLAETAGESVVLRYGRLILATGARERFIPFPGWTLAGVTGVGGLQALIKGGAPVAGKRIIIAGSGLLLWASAFTAKAQGARIVAIIEQANFSDIAGFVGRLSLTPDKLVQALRMRAALWNTPYWCSSYVSTAHGEAHITGVTVNRGGKEVEMACDHLACAFGLRPNTELAAMLGCHIDDSGSAPVVAIDDWQQTSQATILAAGECTGVGGMELSCIEGRIAGYTVVNDLKAARALFGKRERYRRFVRAMEAAFKLKSPLHLLPKQDTVFCRCEDVAYADIRQHTSWRSAKLQTRCGMGPCQGRICGDAASLLLGWNTSQSRPPFSPARIETLLQAKREKLT